MDVNLAILPDEASSHAGWMTDSEKKDAQSRQQLDALAAEESFRVQRKSLIAKHAVEAGANLCSLDEANAIVWLAMGDPTPLIEILDTHPQVQWVQLPWAGVENFLEGGLFKRDTTFTCAKGAYGTQVAEHALMLTLSLMRSVVLQSRTPAWNVVEPDSLFGKRVTILGGGGIATELVSLLQPFGCEITVLRKRPEALPGVSNTLSIDNFHKVLPNTEVLVLALSLTPETIGLIGEAELSLLPKGAYVVNVARGRHIDTAALEAALSSGHLGGAGLDVTEPEPLPEASLLWKMENVLVTSHCADSYEYVSNQLARRVADNVTRLATGEPLHGVVDRSLGY